MQARVVVAAGAVQPQIDAWLADHAQGARAIVAEGVFTAIEVPPSVAVARIAAGCVCCLGRTPLRVTLLRTLRASRADQLLLVLSSADHLDRVRALLTDGSMGVRFALEG